MDALSPAVFRQTDFVSLFAPFALSLLGLCRISNYKFHISNSSAVSQDIQLCTWKYLLPFQTQHFFLEELKQS